MEKQLHNTIRAKKSFLLLTLMMISLLLVGTSCVDDDTSGAGSIMSGGLNLNTPTSITDFSQLKMLDANNGWATTARSVLKTTDGGRTWTDLTPSDWEANSSQATAADSTTNIQGIIGADFLDTNHAWIVAVTKMSQSDMNAARTAVATAVTVVNGTPTADTSKLPPVTYTVYVRSTIDGGRTWMTSSGLAMQDLVGVSEPNFIDAHEGWLELTQLDTKDSHYIGYVYHTIDGGVTWQLDTIPGAGTGTGGGGIAGSTTGGIIDSANQLDGMTIAPVCVDNPNNSQSSTLSPCAASPDSTAQGCTVAGTSEYFGLATAAQYKALFLSLSHQANSLWLNDSNYPIPGGAPGQTLNSLVVTSPPMMFPDGTGILPVQVQAGSYNFFLHLYKVTITSAEGDYIINDLSPTTTFSGSLIVGRHTLSAPDMQHIFVVGQEQGQKDGTPGNWNLYEFNGNQWMPLTSQTDATIPTPSATGAQPAFFNEMLSNLDFISPTEGWATDGSDLYHITIANNVATWSHIYPATNASETSSSSSSSPQQITLSREPGQVVPPPANPAPCNNNSSNTNGNNNVLVHNSGSDSGNLPLSVFNALPTVMHTWYNAESNTPSGWDKYPHANGTGTYANPITFAIAEGSRTFKMGDIIYIPELQKYFFAEDTCDACQNDLNQGRQDHIDLWTGHLSDQCAVNIKVPPTIYSQDPDPEPVHYLIVPSSDTADQNYTVNVQPFSCG